MKALALSAQCLLAFCGIVALTGGIWFWGDYASYAATALAVCICVWLVTWHNPRAVPLAATAALLSVIFVTGIAIATFSTSDPEAAAMLFGMVSIAVGGLWVWVKSELG
jgi:hypothetical protein